MANPYAASKHLIESIPHPNVVFMRFHTVYNEEARTGMFFDKLFKGTLEYVTDHERDFIHRDDLLDAIEIIINTNNNSNTTNTPSSSSPNTSALPNPW